MRPTSDELLESIAQALEDQVLPVVQDKWAASTLRSATQLLRHVAIRVAREPRMLAEDSADARAVLMGIAPELSRLGLADLAAGVGAALGAGLADPLDVAAADALNEGYLRAIESVIAARDRLRQAGPTADVHAALLAYLQRRLARERGLFVPVFLTPPF
jgi:hypothetical protein